VVNNIFAATGGGYAYVVQHPSAIKTSDYNDYYTTGTNIAYWNGNITDLSGLQTANSKDSHSVSSNPLFVSDTDLHSTAAAIDSAGTPLAEVIVDIDGDPRDSNFPDMGADEFYGGLTAIEENRDLSGENLIPDQFTVFQNYPNPFNPSTKIKFGLPERALVNITIYNMLGQKVMTLVNEKMNAGYHVINFQVDANASGTYIYQIRAGKFVESKRMFILK
jgi:hypothetical protein